MKLQIILFFALFAIFIIQVQAIGDFPNTCQELFNTTNCNKCQSLIFDRIQNPGQCATGFNLDLEVHKVIKDSGETPKPYNLTFFKKGLNNYCQKGFHCSQHEAEKIYNKVQNVCKHELTVKFDWSDRNYNDVTAYAAYQALLIYYTGIPARKAFCTKSNHGGFCSFEFTEKLVKWIKKKTHADPDAIVSHDYRFVITGDGKKIRIPRSFFCDPCWRKMARIYIDYINEHRLKKSVENNIWGSNHNLEKLYLPDCTYHKRGLGEILRERSDVSERSANPAFGINNFFVKFR